MDIDESNHSSVKILVAYHKKFDVFENSVFQPIHVGKVNSDLDLRILGDDSLKNISYLNLYYCELTATYWAWKNLHAEYLGICHYRRYFFHRNKFSLSSINSVIVNIKSKFNYWLGTGFLGYDLNRIRVYRTIDRDKLVNEFSEWIKVNCSKSNVDIYCLKPLRLAGITNKHHFSSIGEVYINQLLDVVRDKHPYLFKFLKATLNSDRLHYANMIIMKKNIFDQYCSIMFDILGQHHNLNINNLQEYSRVPAYLGELITDSFILMKKDQFATIECLNELFIEV